MREGEGPRVEAEPWPRGSGRSLRVELVAEDRVADREHVDTQLVTATGVGRELHARPGEPVARSIPVAAALEHLVVGAARLSLGQVHDLAGAAERLLAERQIDRAAVVGEMARHERLVGLVDRAGLERHGERAVRLRVSGEHDHARGVAVEPVDDAGPGVVALQPRHEAVRLLGADSGHREQPGLLVADDEERVGEENRVAGIGHGTGYTNRPMKLWNLASVLLLAAASACTPKPADAPSQTPAQPAAAATPAAPAGPTAEPGVSAARQLTFPDRFIKAGEAYFSPDMKRIVFQAIEVPPGEDDPAEFYAMFVCDVVRDGAGDIVGVDNIRRVSPKGSANTCGWFHPTDPNRLLFASTVGAPTAENAPGYQRGTSRYRWAFPPETRIVEVDLRTVDGSAASLKPLEGDGKAYMAEASWSPDGRFILFCSLESGDGDLYIRDTKTGARRAIVTAGGYDGGPFFSPDGKRICYRSDRNRDNLLQVFVADLVFDRDGSITGIENETQLTSNEHVNWCPFFRPDGKTLVYASSEIGHRNYEVFEIALPERPGAAPVRRRVTEADGADVLPVFCPDGKWLLWTGQRHEGRSSQLYIGRYRDQGAAK
jgi:TolB protein